MFFVILFICRSFLWKWPQFYLKWFTSAANWEDEANRSISVYLCDDEKTSTHGKSMKTKISIQSYWLRSQFYCHVVYWWQPTMTKLNFKVHCYFQKMRLADSAKIVNKSIHKIQNMLKIFAASLAFRSVDYFCVIQTINSWHNVFGEITFLAVYAFRFIRTVLSDLRALLIIRSLNRIPFKLSDAIWDINSKSDAIKCFSHCRYTCVDKSAF